MPKRPSENNTASGEIEFLSPNPWSSLDGNATRHHQRQGHVNKLITPETRKEIHALKDRLDKQLRDVIGFCELFNNIRKTTFMARQSARCLLTNEPFEVWKKIRDQAEFDAFRDLAEKQNTKKNHPAKGDVDIAPQMRRRIIEIKKGAR